MRGSHGLSARRAQRTMSSRPEGPKAGPKGRNLEVGARRAPRLLWFILEPTVIRKFQNEIPFYHFLLVYFINFFAWFAQIWNKFKLCNTKCITWILKNEIYLQEKQIILSFNCCVMSIYLTFQTSERDDQVSVRKKANTHFIHCNGRILWNNCI